MSYSVTGVLYLGAANTGLTLEASLFDELDQAAAGLVTDYLDEIEAGSGTYLFTVQIPDGHQGHLRFDTDADVFMTSVPINPGGGIEYIDMPISVIASSTSVAVASAASTASCGALTGRRGDTWMLVITGLGSLEDRDKLYFTLKDDPAKADTAALVQIEETDGLKYINGAAAGTAANGDITVSDEEAGDIIVTLAAVESAKLSPATYYGYDIQTVTAGVVATRISDQFIVTADYSKAVS